MPDLIPQTPATQTPGPGTPRSGIGINTSFWLKAITIALAVISSTMALSELFGHFVAKEPWYWIGLSALATAGLGSYLLKKESFEKVVNIAVTVTIVSVIMMAITTIWPSASIKGGKEWAEQRVERKEEIKKKEEIKIPRRGNISQDITLKKGDVYKYSLQNMEATHWILAPTGVNYNIKSPDGVNFRVYYSDGEIIDVKGRVGLPDKCPAKFKVINLASSLENIKIIGY